MKHLRLLTLLLILPFISCDQDDMDGLPEMEDDTVAVMNEFDPDFVANFGSSITRNLLVKTVDLNNNPLSNVNLSIGNATAETDANGIAIINNAPMFERFGYVVAEKAGFIHASRAFAPTTSTNQVTIMMLPATVVGSTASGEVATITNGNGASVALSGNYINPDGSPYTGTVDVILHHLDPSDAAMNDQMPGMLYAQDQDGEAQGLITLGMLAVELRGDNGEDLNLMSGSTATITMPVDPSIMSYAPPTIPLWYFDEVNGVWIEEGQATLIGNEYVGEVAHFSFWNCDIPTESSVICFELEDQDGNPLANTLVTITSATFGTRSGITNIDGEVCGYLPNNEALELNVYSDTCDDTSLFNTTVGPFTVDTTVPVTVILSGVVVTETVTGTLSDCNANPLSNGYAVVTYQGGGATVVIEADGSFELTIIRCSPDIEFTIKGIDIDSATQSPIQTYNFTTPLTDVGNLLTCETVTEFIQYNVDNGAITFFTTENIDAQFNPNGSIPTVTISSFEPNTDDGIYLYGQLMDDPYVGVYDFLDWNDPIDLGFNIAEFLNMSNVNNEIVYNLTAIGEIGEYIDINFSGNYEDFSGNPHFITGTVHVLRDN